MKTGLKQLLDEARRNAARLDEKWKHLPWTDECHPGYAHIVCIKSGYRHDHLAFWDIEHAEVKALEEEIEGADVEIYRTLYNQDNRFVNRPGLEVCPSTYIKEWRKHHRYPKSDTSTPEASG